MPVPETADAAIAAALGRIEEALSHIKARLEEGREHMKETDRALRGFEVQCAACLRDQVTDRRRLNECAAAYSSLSRRVAALESEVKGTRWAWRWVLAILTVLIAALALWRR